MGQLSDRLTALIQKMEESDERLQQLLNEHCESMNQGLEQLKRLEELDD